MASNLKELPVTSNPNQRFTSTLNINGQNTALGFFLRFSEVAGHWLLDVLRNDVPVMATIPLVPGKGSASNLLRQYKYLELGEIFLVNISGTSEQCPGPETLGTDWVLLWGDNT